MLRSCSGGDTDLSESLRLSYGSNGWDRDMQQNYEIQATHLNHSLFDVAINHLSLFYNLM
jgi:hypothetical protein